MTLRDKLTQIHQMSAEALALLPTEPIADNVWRVNTSQGLMDALRVGGDIVVEPGSDYIGNFIAAIPGTRLTAVDCYFGGGDPFEPTLAVMGSDIVVNGPHIPAMRDDREPVRVGSPAESDPARQPDAVVLNDIGVLALLQQGGKRGIALHARGVSLLNCDVRGFWRKGQDSQAVWINNGPGPYLIDGGYYEASGENILLGGAEIPCGQNPSAIIRNATLRKPQEWKGKGYTIKNLFEVKAGKGVTLENCVLDGCWGGEGQAGYAVMLTPDTQDFDMPWLTVDGVEIVSNRLLNVEHGIAMRGVGRSGQAMMPSRYVTIFGNYLPSAGIGLMVQQAPGLELAVKQNTLLTRHSFLQLHGDSIRMDFQRNVVQSGSYGIMGDDNVAAGLPTLAAAIIDGDVSLFRDNVIEQSARYPLKFPAGNTVVAPGALAGLLDTEGKLKDGGAGY